VCKGPIKVTWLRHRRRTAGARRHVGATTRQIPGDLWDKLNRSARDVETYNLDKKPLVFTIFGLLAEASRG
jgi:DNA polymerase III subunit delta'